MILCVNANAAIDKTVVVRGFHLNDIHRPEHVLAIPGGKGINVARGLVRLGESAVVSGWVGGFAGRFIEIGLQNEGIETAFTYTYQESRTCLSILDPDSNTMTEIYEKGEPVAQEKVDEFRREFEKNIDRYAAVTFSGSLPPGVPPDFYGSLLEIARAAGVPGMLDTSGEALRQGIACRPMLVKPNRRELGEMLGRDLSSLNHVAAAATDLATLHGTNVVVSLGAEGAMATNGSILIHVRPPQVTIKSAVGSGDCMLAGIAFGLVHSFSIEEAVKYGVAAGTANALTIGAGNFTMQDFNSVLAQVTVIRY